MTLTGDCFVLSFRQTLQNRSELPLIALNQAFKVSPCAQIPLPSQSSLARCDKALRNPERLHLRELICSHGTTTGRMAQRSKVRFVDLKSDKAGEHKRKRAPENVFNNNEWSPREINLSQNGTVAAIGRRTPP